MEFMSWASALIQRKICARLVTGCEHVSEVFTLEFVEPANIFVPRLANHLVIAIKGRHWRMPINSVIAVGTGPSCAR